MTMNIRLTTLRQLDRQTAPLKKQGLHTPKPGWIRTLRKAFGMTIKQLAKRLNVSSSRIVKLEMSEKEGAITLHTLQSVAKALNCRFVYGFIPQSSFVDVIKDKAKKIAIQHVKHTSHTMDLEAQSADNEWRKEEVNELTNELLRQAWKHLWEE